MTLDELKSLADASAAVTQPCACAIDSYREWTRVPVDFPESHLRTVGTVFDDLDDVATYAEYHPHGTTYWSADAPIAPRYYPYNDAQVAQCALCGRCALHHVERAGHCPEPRIRVLDPRLIVDVPVPD